MADRETEIRAVNAGLLHIDRVMKLRVLLEVVSGDDFTNDGVVNAVQRELGEAEYAAAQAVHQGLGGYGRAHR
ncbi:hypothetical protein [Leifsonia sp. Leaf264]|uniref:hypothetical protein n=1 Tax=Leifsonia sp. Leaf264 TaxID=1736314 RepID=UPI0006FDC537|nr:hypothetical protein [Leifsonia sp. Leaf264]KQO98363.1 hypothetical protein ASF30_09900 [Leifsonia sp. Leaf264]